ncbi:MAG: 4-(cytidine 5'-diphospho)-2-C-methyl-D-erythritol kinase [Rhodobacteraceae bacterium]|nr:4-(cytidine 5'-diphospho)-2-C-methyl-D-erythritol kinase [Paracoccaceae bacterium]
MVFAGIGDSVTAVRAAKTSLSVIGPQSAGVPAGPENLVLRAAALLRPAVPAALTLTKRLPSASGIGGGSADAAATIKVLTALSRQPMPGRDETLRLGADLPVCVDGRPVRMRGIGEILDPLPSLPRFWIVLANPGVNVSTPEIFRSLHRRENAPMPIVLPRWTDFADFVAWLAGQRNDLEWPAQTIAPAIAATLSRLRAAPRCALARMSGSGATCFGLFENGTDAAAAAAALRSDFPCWWVEAAPRLD